MILCDDRLTFTLLRSLVAIESRKGLFHTIGKTICSKIFILFLTSVYLRSFITSTYQDKKNWFKKFRIKNKLYYGNSLLLHPRGKWSVILGGFKSYIMIFDISDCWRFINLRTPTWILKSLFDICVTLTSDPVIGNSAIPKDNDGKRCKINRYLTGNYPRSITG